MASFIDKLGFDIRAGGKIRILEERPKDFIVERTVLVRICDPNPRQLLGEILFLDGELSDEQILVAFADDDLAWKPLPNHGQPGTQLCLKLTKAGKKRGISLAFQLHETGFEDRFIAHDGGTSFAVMGIETQGGLYEPTWVGHRPDHKTVKVYVAGPGTKGLDIDYVLGINVDGIGASKDTPILVDPKIENNG